MVHEIDYLDKVIYEIHEFPEMLARDGHEITFFEFQEGADWRKRNIRTFKKIQGRVIKEAQLNLVTPHQLGVQGVDRLWATISCIPRMFNLFRRNRFDVVLNFAVPTYGIQTLLIARLFRVPIVHRALDVSHEIRRSIYRLPILLVEKILYRSVDVVSANNPAMADYVVSLSGRTKPTKVDYPPLDIKHFVQQGDPNSLRKILGLKKADKVMTYMGSFFYFSGLPEALITFSQVVKKDEDIKFLIIGGGEQDSSLRDLVQNLGISDQVVFTGFVDYSELPNYLELAKVGINPLIISKVASVAFPHKVLQYLASGLHVVSTELDGLVAALGNLPSVNWVSSPSEVIRVAVKILREPVLPSSQDSSGKVLISLFEPDVALRSLVQTLDSAIETNNKGREI